MVARVIKRNTKTIIAEANDKEFECSLRGKLKQKNSDILVGDFVEINEKTLSVEKVVSRKNKLIRPLVSNVDQIFIVVSNEPTPDFLLVDQMIISANELGISVYIVVNKEDLISKEFEQQVKADYNKVVKKVIVTSAKLGTGIEELKKYLDNKMSVLVGQSGVGKSSLINSLVNKNVQTEGELSSKISRGVNTTRYNKVFSVDAGLVIDSPGFSAISLGTIDPRDLASKYTDFAQYSKNCEYRTCDHIHNQNCGIKAAVENGRLSERRYKRYILLFEKYFDMWQNRYRHRKTKENKK